MDVICYLSNLPLSGITVTDKPDGSLVRDKIPLSAFGYNMLITQDIELLKLKQSELHGQFVRTSQVLIHGVNSSADLEEKMNMLTEMLSLATNSQVGFIGWEHIKGKSEDGCLGRRWTISGCYSAVNSPFCLVRTSEVVHFIESCWQAYGKLRIPRKLNIAIDLFTIPDAKRLPLELMLATTFILLENLKASYADGVYQFKKGRYRNSDGKVLDYAPLVKEMFEQVGMPETDTWVNLRNEIIHSGLCTLEPEDIHKQYSLCRDAITEYLLRLLGYQGEFFLYSDRGITSKNITTPTPESIQCC
ncbi:hypothetical protein TVA88_08000 [Aeromonas hydrophila]|uniref:hypothetical protein n=1 Tax=Aeromonas hydrophila TaxID=644 RepID=UPI00311DA766